MVASHHEEIVNEVILKQTQTLDGVLNVNSWIVHLYKDHGANAQVHFVTSFCELEGADGTFVHLMTADTW